MTRFPKWVVAVLYVVPLLGLGALGTLAPRQTATAWRQAVNPGALSAAHGFLKDDCMACHTPGRGVERASCVLCHADNKELLALEPTAFHAHVSECASCHPEHQGRSRRPTAMDHGALARIGLRELGAAGAAAGSEAKEARRQLTAWLRSGRQAGGGEGQTPADGPSHITPEEAALDCASCHANRGQRQTAHARLMGRHCASCHGTGKWTIPEFRHPSPRSTSCAQCHQAPPSHYMEHFNMVSRKAAKQPGARVEQCHRCHQVDAWNDIKGEGWYQHH